MPVTFSALPHSDLDLVRFAGFVSRDDVAAALQDMTGQRRLAPAQTRLVDLGDVESWAPDLAEATRDLAAREAWAMPDQGRALCVFFAPTPIARDLAALLSASCAALPGLVSVVSEDAGEALAMLGQSELSLADLPTAA